ncbi:MAG: Tetratricopeptide 2 repeat protein [Paenibacillus sp.]|nr:Tetratricopeptide 2 repeat protein [Paenibacillus sp.]
MDGESCIRKAYDDILRGDFEGAIHWFELAIEAEPDNAGYYHKCAVSCARSNKWLKAKQCADVACELEPDNEEFRFHAQFVHAKLLLEEANVLLALSPPKLLEAGEKLRQVVKLDPLSFDGFYTLAMIRYSEGDPEAALAHAREALLLDPQHAAAKRLFADIKRKLRKIKKTTRSTLHRD